MNIPNKRHFIWYLLVIVFLIFVILSFVSPLLMWDENVYLGNARGHLGVSNLKEDFRFPLPEYLISFVWLIFGESIIIAKLLVIAFSVGSVYLFYKISEHYFKERAIWPTLLFSFSSLFIFWGFRIYTEPFALFFLLFSFYMLLKNHYFISGILGGLSFLSKFNFALYSVAVVAVLFFEWDKKIIDKIKKIGYYCLGFLVIISPWLIYNYISYGNPIWDLTEQARVIALWTRPEPIVNQIINLLGILGILFVFLLFGFFEMLKRRKKEDLIILLSVVLSIVYFLFFINLKDARYHYVNLGFYYIIAFEGVLFLQSKFKKYSKWIFAIALIFVLIFAGFAIGGTVFRGRCDANGAEMKSINFIKSNSNSGDLIISNYWPWFGYYNNNRVMSFFDPSIKNMLYYKPKFLVYSPNLGDSYNKSALDDNLVLVKDYGDDCGNRVFIYGNKV